MGVFNRYSQLLFINTLLYGIEYYVLMKKENTRYIGNVNYERLLRRRVRLRNIRF